MRTALNSEQIAEFQAAIRALPPVRVPPRGLKLPKLERNRLSRLHLAQRGGLSTTVNLTPEAMECAEMLQREFDGIDNRSQAIDVALRWVAAHLAERPRDVPLTVGVTP